MRIGLSSQRVNIYCLFLADEICKAIKECKDMQALCLEGNTVGVDAAKAIAEAL